MEDNYIYFSIDGRDLKINKENPEDILMLRTHSRGKMKNPRWNQIKVKIHKSNGYKLINIAPKQYLLHRVNYYAWNQEWNIHDSSKNNQIDHEDIKKANNNIENLRVVTHQQNQWNRKAKGYYFNKKLQKWQSRIKINGKQKHLGLFILEEDAHQAYLDAKKIYHKIQ